ncbi:retrotransposon protein, putative, unclassified [Tanacetum coccineum]
MYAPTTSSSGFVPNLVSQQPCIPPNRDDWDHLFQPMFDEYFTPPPNAVSQVQEAVAPRVVDLTDSLVLTSIDQDATSSSTPSTQEQVQSPTFLKVLKNYQKQQSFVMIHLMNLLMKNQLLKGHHRMKEEGIDFEESFAPVARIEAIRIFIANAAHKNMMIFQMDVKIEFLNGAVDPTLFTRQAGNDLLLMTTKFKMSMMGQMSFFLGLQILQSLRDIFINQSKYAFEIVKKYGMLTTDSIDTPLVEKSKLDEDLQGTQVDATLYHGMIGSLMYLTSSRPDFIHAVCLCARYQAKPTEKHLQAIPLYCDNKSTIALCCNNVLHSLAKHIDVCYHFIKEKVENGIVELYFVRTEYQLADIFTKPLPRERFNFLIEKLGMRSMSAETLKSLAGETDE